MADAKLLHTCKLEVPFEAAFQDWLFVVHSPSLDGDKINF
jgi:hypothetical protein